MVPPTPQQITFAADRDLEFQPREWQNRSQPTWINNEPTTTVFKASQRLDWGRPAKVVKLDAPTPVRSKTPDQAMQLLDAMPAPADVHGEDPGVPALKIPKSLELVLEPATGDPSQKYRGVHVLDSTLAANIQTRDKPPAPTINESVELDQQTLSPRDAAIDQRIVQEKTRLLRERAHSNAGNTSRISQSFQTEFSEQIDFTDLTPPRRGYSEPGIYLERSEYQGPADPPSAGQFIPLGNQPEPLSLGEPDYVFPDPQSSSNQLQAPPLQNEPRSYSEDVITDLEQTPRSTQPDSVSDPFGENDQFQPRGEVQDGDSFDPYQKPGKTTSPAVDDLEAELKRLEQQGQDRRDSDLEQDLRDLGLGEEDIPKTEGDLDDDLPTRRDEDEDDGKTVSDCDRIYDDRDCCLEEQDCQNVYLLVRNNTLAKYSLDISPSFAPGEDDDAEVARLQAKKLSTAPSRNWMDRHGNTVASGMLEDLRQGKIYVRSDSGEIISVDYRELSRDDLCFVNAWWGLPTECSLGNEPQTIRNWTMTTFTWKASGNCHKPLYFQQPQLERYGHSAGPVLQPVLSGAHFFANVILLPYNAGIHPPTECLYELGYYRPGDCAPWLVPAVPIHRRAIFFQTAFGLGLWGLF